jgi:4,5-dihydroxyphthalate decarboxylase
MDQIYETNALTVAAPFIVHDIERTRALMGTDYWPFGIDANRNAIATFLRHLKAQEIINRVPEISELFIDVKVAA